MRGHLGFRGILLLLAMGLLMVGPAGAAESSEKADGTVVLEKTVVTATMTEEPVSELGVAATIITAEDIEKRRAASVEELLRDVPGLSIMRTGSHGGTTSLFTRGGESDYTLVLIDGIQVNDGGGAFDFSTLSTTNVERIEIIRGPQSALYGSDAIGGVINVITKKGAPGFQARLSTASGVRSDHEHYMGEHNIEASGGAEQGSFSLGYGRSDDNGVIDVNNYFRNNTFSGRFDIHPTDDFNLTFTGRLEDSLFEFPTENNGDRFDKDYPGLDPHQWQEEVDYVVGLTGSYHLTSWWEHVVRLGYHDKDNKMKDPANPAHTAYDWNDWEYNTHETRAMVDYHTNIRFPQEGDFKSTLTLGIEAEEETYDLDYVDPFSGYEENEDRTNLGYYLQEQITLFDRLHLVGGFRVEDNSDYDTVVVPRGSVAFEIFETGTKLRAAVGEGFKEPTFLETFGYGAWATPNPDLKPEKSFSWEVGVDQSLWEDRIMLALTYFHNEYEDMIEGVTGANWTTTYFNIQGAETQGVEAEVTFRPGYGLTLGGGYTYLDTEVTDDGNLGGIFFDEGEKLIRRPTHKGSFFIDWVYEGLNVHLNGSYVGERDDSYFDAITYASSRVENDSYFVLDVTASYTMDVNAGPLQQIKVFGKGFNMTDEDYEEAYGYSSPGIAGFLGVQFGLGTEG